MSHPAVPQPVTASREALLVRLFRAAAVGAGAGLLAGAVCGALARLAMRVVGAMSTDAQGLQTDDGLTVGVVTVEGFLSILVFSALPTGAAGGLVYAAVRHALPRPAAVRAAIMVVVAGLVVGSMTVGDSTTVDFGTLRPVGFSVAAFVALPALGAWLTVTLVEWWHRAGRQRGPGAQVAVAVVGGLGMLAALPVTVALGILALVVGGIPALSRAWSGASGRRLVLVLLTLVAGVGLLGLAADVVSLATDGPVRSPLLDLAP